MYYPLLILHIFTRYIYIVDTSMELLPVGIGNRSVAGGETGGRSVME
jgi:hypothetical protein